MPQAMPLTIACHLEIRIGEHSHLARAAHSTMARKQASFTRPGLGIASRPCILPHSTTFALHISSDPAGVSCWDTDAPVMMAHDTRPPCLSDLHDGTCHSMRPSDCDYSAPGWSYPDQAGSYCENASVTGKNAISRHLWKANILIFHNSQFT